MKKKIYLLCLIATGILGLWYSCEIVPEETCELDNFCEDKFVTACCTETECVYHYNGDTYTENELGDLADDLGCTAKSAFEKSVSTDVTERLIDLMNRVKAKVHPGK